MFFYILDKLNVIIGSITMLAWPWLNAGVIRGAAGVRATGIPLIRAGRGAQISFGSGVSLLSSNLFYHAQMFRGVKLLADRPGAKIMIGDNCRINGACIHAWQEVRIGKNCLIAANVQILDSNGHELCMDRPSERLKRQDTAQPVWIGNNVWIGLNAIILPGTWIGDGCVVAAGSMVKGEFPAGSIIGGVPGKVIKAAG